MVVRILHAKIYRCVISLQFRVFGEENETYIQHNVLRLYPPIGKILNKYYIYRVEI